MGARRRIHGMRGFTTIELLATLAILALLTAGVLAGLGIGRQSWRASRERQSRGELEAGMRAIRDVLARAAPIVQTRPASAALALFDATPDAVDFVALNEPGAQWGGFLRVRIESTAGKLTMTSGVYRPAAALADASATRTALILDGVTEFRLRYFGQAGENANGRWFDEWRGVERSPELVAIRIGRKVSGRAETAEDVVALRQN